MERLAERVNLTLTATQALAGHGRADACVDRICSGVQLCKLLAQLDFLGTCTELLLTDIEENIASEHYFTAADGVIGARWYAGVTQLSIEAEVPKTLCLLTFCVLVLRNNSTVIGQSACASQENFDAEAGRKIARQNALNKLWWIVGNELNSELAGAA